MFTGIIEALGEVKSVEVTGSNRSYWIESALSDAFKIDQSVAHNGVCLTVDALKPGLHRVTAIAETLQKTHLDSWKAGITINLERCLQMGGRLDGHMVQGHVDTVGECVSVEDQNGSWLFTIQFPEAFAPLMIEKGSICLNGISLTAFNVTVSRFSVAIIPYTWQNTNMHALLPGQKVNLEFDMVGKYIQRSLSLKTEAAAIL
ncbi:MAG: riboflavin synthase [Chitinophagaceae bacterium]|nr:riboflavin synthase [Chitinophagaceae bacterium]